MEKNVQWLSQSVEVDKSVDLQSVVFSGFIHEDLWHRCDNIKDEISSQVVLADVVKILVGSGLLHEVKKDLNQLNDVDSDLKFVELVLPSVFRIDGEAADVLASGGLFWGSERTLWHDVLLTASTFVEMRENDQVW